MDTSTPPPSLTDKENRESFLLLDPIIIKKDASASLVQAMMDQSTFVSTVVELDRKFEAGPLGRERVCQNMRA